MRLGRKENLFCPLLPGVNCSPSSRQGGEQFRVLLYSGQWVDLITAREREAYGLPHLGRLLPTAHCSDCASTSLTASFWLLL